MKQPRPSKPCVHCTSTRFAHVPAVIVLSPFVSVVTRNVGRREGRSGEALVCLGCGHIDYFMQSLDTVLQQAGATEVNVEVEGPYR